MPPPLRLFLLLMLGLFGLQPVSYGYDAPGGFVSGVQTIVATSPETETAIAESDAPVSLNFSRTKAAWDNSESIGLISNFVAAESGAGFTFRGSNLAPETVFNEGFTAKGSSTDLLAHALDSSSPPSGFVSTSLSPDVAGAFGENIYVVRPTNGINVNQVLGPASPFPGEMEIAIPGQISPANIRGVTLPNQGMSILNPNWHP